MGWGSCVLSQTKPSQGSSYLPEGVATAIGLGAGSPGSPRESIPSRALSLSKVLKSPLVLLICTPMNHLLPTSIQLHKYILSIYYIRSSSKKNLDTYPTQVADNSWRKKFMHTNASEVRTKARRLVFLFFGFQGHPLVLTLVSSFSATSAFSKAVPHVPFLI